MHQFIKNKQENKNKKIKTNAAQAHDAA